MVYMDLSKVLGLIYGGTQLIQLAGIILFASAERMWFLSNI